MGAFGANGEALSGAGEAVLLLGVQASREVPGLLGLQPILGRGFAAADELPGSPHVVNQIRASVAGLDGALPVIDVRSADDIVAASARPQQLTGSVIDAFAVSALVLAAIGLYGLISYSVAQRRQELGVRAAIGARPRDLMQLVLGQSLRVSVIGIVCGAAAALAVSRLLSTQLFGVSGRDPRVYGAVALLILVVTLLASALPTLRAARANPLDALRIAQ